MARRSKHPKPPAMFSSRDLMTLAALFTSLVVIALAIYELQHNPQLLQLLDRSLTANVPTKSARDDTRTPDSPTIPSERCNAVDFELLAEIQDKSPTSARDNPAIFQLLCVARQNADRLASQSRRDVLLANLLSSPDVYRGQLVHRRGVLKRLVRIEIPDGDDPLRPDYFYEGWFFAENQSQIPEVVLFGEPPIGLAPGDNIQENIIIDGYFLKLLAFRGKDSKARAVPMWVTSRLDQLPPPDLSWTKTEAYLLGGGLLLFVAILSLWIFGQSKRDDRTLADIRRAARSPLAPVGEPVFEDDGEAASSPTPQDDP